MDRIKPNLKTSQERERSYVDMNRTTREFKVGEHVILKVKPKKSSLKLGSTNLAARFRWSI
jgi:ribosomal protein L21E